MNDRKSTLSNSFNFEFSTELWSCTGPGAWHFVTLPEDVADFVRDLNGKHLGFGTVRVHVKIADVEWNTSLFPDKESGSFLLPIKSDVRKNASLSVGDQMTVKLSLNI